MDGESSKAISVQDTGKELCRGAHSKILEVLYGGIRCKAKRIETTADAEKLGEQIETACEILVRLRHPHIVQFFGTQVRREGAAIVTEYLPYSLANILERYGSLPEPLTHSVLRDASTALTYLHDLSPSVAHGYLVPANVLLTEDFTAKISDVGVSRSVDLLRDLSRESAVYLSPSECPATKGDVYSLGAIMVHVVGGTHPANLTSQSGKSLSNSLGVAERHPLRSLMRDCLASDATKRPSASQILISISLEAKKFPPLSMESRLAHIQVMKGGRSNSPSHPLTITRKASFSPKRMVHGTDEDRCLALAIESESFKLELEELRVSNRGLRTYLEKQMKFVSARDHEMAAKLMAKDQEIMAKQQKLSAQEARVKAAEDNVVAKDATNRGLNLQLRSLQDYLESRAEPHLLNPKAKLKWKRCADLPNGMIFGQAVTVKDTVYFGSGSSTLGETSSDCPHKILKYSLQQDRWSPLTDCPVVGFGMGCYLGELVLVGGAYASQDGDVGSPFALTGDLHLLDDAHQQWKKSLPPLLKARMMPTVVSHTHGLVAIGGIVLDATHDLCLNSVEVYNGESSQWYRAEPLPLACIGMTSALVGDTCYLLGGFTDTEFDQPTSQTFAASLSSMVQEAMGKNGLVNGSLDEQGSQVWTQLLDSPRYAATAANLGNSLLTLGGTDERLEHKSGALHVFSPLTNSWIRIEDIPVSCFASAVTKLPGGDLLIIGGMGHDEEDALHTVYRAQLVLN